jgi:hypothetical protein
MQQIYQQGQMRASTCRAGEPRAKLDRMAPSIDSTIRSAGSGAGVEAERAWNVLNIDQ